MNKRITAFAAALLLTASMLTACGNTEGESSETTINVIDNGTSAVETETPGNSDTVDGTTSFVDPADIMGITGDASGEENQPQQTGPAGEETTAAETTLPDNHQDIVNMIQGGQTTTQAAPVTPVIKDYNVKYSDRYGYNQLNDQEKALYKAIVEAVEKLETRIWVDDSVSDEMWVKVYGSVFMQEPQLFWLAGSKVSKGKIWYVEVDQNIISKMQKEIDTEVSKVMGAVEGKSDFEKLEYFHDYLCLNVQFDDSDLYNSSMYGAFSSMRALQCGGYAKAMQYLCDLSGIESVTVVGTTEAGVSHAWNIVKLGGEWYNIDTTWGDPVIDDPDPTYVRHRYFLVPDAWIHNKSHFNINMKTTGTQVKYFTPPTCTAEKYNYFAQKGILFSDKASADEAIKKAMKDAAANKRRTAEIRVSSKDLYDKMTADLKTYASWIKSENSAVKSVSNNCDEATLVIQLNLIYS